VSLTNFDKKLVGVENNRTHHRPHDQSWHSYFESCRLLPGEHFCALSKKIIEKKMMVVRGLKKAIRKTTSHDGTRKTISCFGELYLLSHIISVCDCLRDNIRAKGMAEEWSTTCYHLGGLDIDDMHRMTDLHSEARVSLITGFSLAVELAINGNPSVLVDLVEATEFCERDSTIGVDLKNMLATAFELRGLGKFRGVSNIEAALKTATELVSEIVNHRILPYFPSHWHVEALWTFATAHVCTYNIEYHTGGHCENLPNLTLAQLLELVKWIEYFHEAIANFPEVASTHFGETNSDKRTENSQNALERLAWVQRLSLDELLIRTRNQTEEWLDKVYG
jgi:hypothetical protein